MLCTKGELSAHYKLMQGANNGSGSDTQKHQNYNDIKNHDDAIPGTRSGPIYKSTDKMAVRCVWGDIAKEEIKRLPSVPHK